MTIPAAEYREEFATFDEFLIAVMRAGPRLSAYVDPRLRWANATGAEEVVPSDGGFLVPSDFTLGLLNGVETFATIYPDTDRQPITRGNKIKLPTWDERSRASGSRFGGLRLYRADEGGQVTASMPKLRSVDLYLDKLTGVSWATQEYFDDVPALRAILSRAFRMEAGTVVDSEIIDGSGTSGQMLGVLRSNALIEVEPESGQSPATVRAENVTKMWSRLWAPGQRRAKWLYNQEITSQLFAFADSGLVTFGHDGPRMLGAPLVAHESCKTAGSVGDLLLVVPDQYIIGEKPPEFAESLHVRFVEGPEACFRFIWRIAGHPAWSTPLTPMNGTQTVSPFVAIAAR
jgi:HK97 family phage major capsid protein